MQPLEWDAETMRQMGYRVIDLLVDYWQTLPDRPIGRRADLATLEPLLALAVAAVSRCRSDARQGFPAVGTLACQLARR